jgi:hypothetical protein
MTTPGMQGEVSSESMKKATSSAVGSAPHAKPVSPRSTGNHAEQNWIKPRRGKPFDLLIYRKSWNWKVKKEIPVKATFYVGVADPRDCEATFHALSVAATQMERTEGFDKAAALPS